MFITTESEFFYFQAFSRILTHPDSAVESVLPASTEEVKKAFVSSIVKLMTPQQLKFQAVIELRCSELDGVLHIQVLLSELFSRIHSI